MKKNLLFLVIAVVLASCKNTWNADDKEAFFQACTDDAKSWAGSEERAKTYCNCVFEKMARIYPNENDALEHIDMLTKDTSLIKCKEDILNGK